MKKVIVFVLTVTLLLSAVAFAQPIALDGYTYYELQNFNHIENGIHEVRNIPGFFLPDIPGTFRLECEVLDGTVTFYETNFWGAFPSYDQARTDLTKNKSGWCFYIKNGLLDAVLSMGFNAADNKNYVIGDFVPYMLVDVNGEVYADFSVWVSANSQGGISIPMEFEGYVYLPFTSFCINDGTGTGAAYDPSVGIVTPIYAPSDNEVITFGAFYLYDSDQIIDPDNTPTNVTPSPSHQNPTQESTQQPTEALTEQPTEQATAIVTEQPTEQVTQEVDLPTDKPNVTEDIATGEATEMVTEQTTQGGHDETEEFPFGTVVLAVIIIVGVGVVILIKKKRK